MRHLSISMIFAVLIISSPASAQTFQQGTKDRMSAYVRVAVAWFTNESCSFVTGEQRTAFEEQVTNNTVGLGGELDAVVKDKRQSNAVLFQAQGEAKKFADINYSNCDAKAEAMVQDGILEATAINHSVGTDGPYVDPRHKRAE